MRKYLKIAFLVLLMILAVLAVSSCNKGGNDDTTTVEDSSAVTTADDSNYFNKGKVVYEVKKTGGAADALPDENVGSRMTADGQGVALLFNDGFDSNDPTCGGTAIPRTDDSCGVVDGKLCVPYDEKTGVGGGWTTWCPSVDTNFKEYKQIQLSGKMEIVGGNSCQTTGLIGCFVDNYTFSIADNYGDGIWLAFLKNPSAICVLGSDQSHWGWGRGGNVTVPVTENVFDGQFSFDIVCTSKRVTYVYINEKLEMTITLEKGKIEVFNSAGESVYTQKYDISCAKGTNFSVFCHGGGLMIDEMQVMAGKVQTAEEKTEIIATPCEGYSLGLDITDRDDLVGICYSMWFNAIHGNGTGEITNALNVSELLEQYEFSSRYGFGTKDDQHNALTKFHYWAEPAQGYYRSTDAEAARNNMKLIYEAGVDFVILDYTYATSQYYYPGTKEWDMYIDGPMNTLLDTIMQMRAEGQGTPYVVMWMNNKTLFNQVYQYYYGQEKWKDCFVYWNDKPFIMEWNYETLETSKFTVRAMYGLQGNVKTGQWSYLEVNNGKTVSYDKDGYPEQISVSVAAQETYMSDSTAHGRDGGRFWCKQWQKAFSARPKIVTVTWWNEWCAQLLNDGSEKNPLYVFTDNFNQEYSRDIEPMKGGHGDQYYQWLCEYVRAYKAGEECPTLIEKD